MEAQAENFERRQAIKRKRVDSTPLPSDEHEEDNTENYNEARCSSWMALTEEVLVERVLEDMEKRKLQMYCEDIENVSDVHITENSGLLSKLLPGNMILADRGFTIQESVGLYHAKVKLPPFTRGKNQLSRVEIDAARRLSRVRIHVERIIGLVRQKYTIFQSTLPINLIACDEGVSAIDKIIIVCCALCNCCDSVVPSD